MPATAARPWPLAAAGFVLLCSLAGLGRRPFGPEEAGLLADGRSPWRSAVAAGSRVGLSAETAARLPGVLAAAAAAGITAGAAAGPAAAAAAALSPPLFASARRVGPAPFQALAAALALRLMLGRARRARRLLALAVVAATLAPSLVPRAPPGERLAAVTLGAWGGLIGPDLAPWRLDVVVPAGLTAALLGWLGSGRATAGRALAAVSFVIVAAALGLGAERFSASALAATPLAPPLAWAIGRGAALLPRRVPRLVPLSIGLAAGYVAIASHLVGADLLDPADRVEWDEAAAMLKVLAEEPARLAARPELPPPLRLYAGGKLPPVDEPQAPPGAHSPGAPSPGARWVVVACGGPGGRAGPAWAFEDALGKAGWTLKGELVFGRVEPGWARLHAALTGRPAPEAWLRIRRYEE